MRYLSNFKCIIAEFGDERGSKYEKKNQAIKFLNDNGFISVPMTRFGEKLHKDADEESKRAAYEMNLKSNTGRRKTGNFV